ncbi:MULTISPECIES: SDR family oxidoreductase [Nitrosomonas]|uniref:Possible polyketide synthase n=1 Tax=Nitrosomonas europaea (strain ATCC 19718 / CIP 103999 / KCTC 2705 / NBRC 14298) TaxID=228410 RepID=Q82SS3_NITEU|nr:MULTISPECIES: SDR family oxidoreductase [Nitrosomonas]CAD86146.1 possible polyketide synthase [Nitrosomonas europaea ATCC 19718]SDW62221.1 UDP-glucose 4-epimerase/long-chain acyl-CoA synthetase [Nitrosomonas europaea]SET33293.1 UDP-glucose 4-epimerase/long-chain acyl-CoA synthetase [Nitrosomonas europaea]SJZ73552.1 UDP-glucose 4-epimerase [Nitrosomonas europaea]HBF25055.1 KR domain-containing protein [Nitrosomonas sp.]
MNTYFITGATGVLGSAIVKELLSNPENRLVLLVRAENELVLQKRITELLSFLGVGEKTRDRMDFIRGDVELERFGLHPGNFIKLGDQVTHIIHSAASVRMNYSLERARLAAVTATEHVLQLARLSRKNGLLQKMEAVSTVGVGGRYYGALPEQWLNTPRNFHNTYEQSKAEAEIILKTEVDQGMPITVHRPSMIVGDSQTGRILNFQIFYYLLEFITGRRTWGVMPDISDRHVDAIPVDYVARAISWSSKNPETIGKILHLCAGLENITSLENAEKLARSKFMKMNLPVPHKRVLPVAQFRFLVNSVTPFLPRKIRRSVSALPIFLNYTKNQIFDNTETNIILSSAGLQMPRSDEFLGPVIDYYLSQAYLT